MQQKETSGQPPGNGSASEQPALPAWKAFVVQFSREAEGAGRTFSGRVEHLSSGRRARFNSPEELVATLRRLLDELGRAPP
jgi:hypothetical protein